MQRETSKQAQEQLVSQAFSNQSVHFDHIYTSNAIAEWMRGRARNEVMRFVNKEAHMLELNCGTGMDSTWFAKQGINVFATDNAPGMLEKLDEKIKKHFKIYMLSSSIDNNDKLRAIENKNVVDYIEKPLTERKVFSLL